jgi:hypothetical protein
VALSAEDTVKAFGQAGELAKKFRSAGADYYGCRSSWLKTCKTQKPDSNEKLLGSQKKACFAAVFPSQGESRQRGTRGVEETQQREFF